MLFLKKILSVSQRDMPGNLGRKADSGVVCHEEFSRQALLTMRQADASLHMRIPGRILGISNTRLCFMIMVEGKETDMQREVVIHGPFAQCREEQNENRNDPPCGPMKLSEPHPAHGGCMNQTAELRAAVSGGC